MTRKQNGHSNRYSKNAKAVIAESTARVDVPTNNDKKQLSLYLNSSPSHSRRKNSPRRNLASPQQIRSPTADIATVEEDSLNGTGQFKEEEEEQSEDVDDDNICLICVAKCTCGKTEQQPIRMKRESPVSPVEQPRLRHRLKLRLSSPTPIQFPNTLPKRRGRPPKTRSPEPTPLKLETNGKHAYGTRSHDVIVRDGRGPRKNGAPRRLSNTQSEISSDISDVNLDDGVEEEDEEEDSEDDDSDDLGDSGDDLDIEGEEERAIIAEETRRLRSYSAEDDDADEEDDELDDEEEDIFQEQQFSSSESSPDEDQEFYQNDLYLDAAFCQPADTILLSVSSPPRRNSNGSDIILYENPILRALIEEEGLGSMTPYGNETWYDSEQDQVGWECFIDDTDVEMGEDVMHMDDESTRYGGGDTTDEEDFKLLGPPAANKRKQKKSNNNTVADIVTTANRPPPLATWERDESEFTIVGSLPLAQSPLPSPIRCPHSPPPATPDLPSLDEFFDASLLASSPISDNESMSDASASSSYTVTRAPLSRKDSSATATSFNTETFVTPATRGKNRRKVPMGSYRRKVMLGERKEETREKSVFLKEWYTLQERRNLRQMSKTRNLEFLDFSSPSRGRRREKLRTAQRARNHDGSAELDMQFIKRRRTSDVQGSGSSTAAFMERLGLDLGDASEEEEYDDEEFESESRVTNGIGERMVLDDDLELAQFIVPPPGGIDLSPLFGAVDA